MELSNNYVDSYNRWLNSRKGGNYSRRKFIVNELRVGSMPRVRWKMIARGLPSSLRFFTSVSRSKVPFDRPRRIISQVGFMRENFPRGLKVRRFVTHKSAGTLVARRSEKAPLRASLFFPPPSPLYSPEKSRNCLLCSQRFMLHRVYTKSSRTYGNQRARPRVFLVFTSELLHR